MEREELKSIQDHFGLLGELITYTQALPQGEGTELMVESIMASIVTVTESLTGLVKFVVDNSKKYQKKPPFFERMRIARAEARERRQQEMLEDEEYAEFLKFKNAHNQAEEVSQGRPEGEEQPEAGLPVLKPETSPEVVKDENGDQPTW